LRSTTADRDVLDGGYRSRRDLQRRARQVRRRLDARERDEAGREHQGFCALDIPAGHQDQHQRHRFRPVKQLQLMKFKGQRWELFGDVVSSELGG